MKNLKLLLLLLTVTIGLSSCSKDDEVSSVSGNEYETTFVKITVDNEGSEITVTFDSKQEIMEADIYNIFEFNSDGKVYLEHLNAEGVSEGRSSFGSWEQKDSTITITGGEDLELKVDGNKLTYKGTMEGDSVEMHFTKM